jgi:hypothetical protein
MVIENHATCIGLPAEHAKGLAMKPITDITAKTEDELHAPSFFPLAFHLRY